MLLLPSPCQTLVLADQGLHLGQRRLNTWLRSYPSQRLSEHEVTVHPKYRRSISGLRVRVLGTSLNHFSAAALCSLRDAHCFFQSMGSVGPIPASIHTSSLLCCFHAFGVSYSRSPNLQVTPLHKQSDTSHHPHSECVLSPFSSALQQ
jgi:hypothetical protein